MKPRPTDQNRCPKSGLLDAYLDGQLEPETKANLSEHLRRCESCRLERSDLVALRNLCRNLPAREVSSLVVQRAKSTVSARGRRPARVGLRERLADIYADRPLALHATAVAFGLLVAVLTYGLGRLHQSQAQLNAKDRLWEVAESAAAKEALVSRELDPRLGKGGSLLPGTARLRRSDLIIESMSVPDDSSSAVDEADKSPDADAWPLQPARGAAEAQPTGSPETAELESRKEADGLLVRPLVALQSERHPVVFSDEALKVLEEFGSVEDVCQEITEAAPNWAKLLTDALQQSGLLPTEELPESNGMVQIRQIQRNMIIIMNNGDSKLRMHITIAFGQGVEPQVEVRRAEAEALKQLLPSKP